MNDLPLTLLRALAAVHAAGGVRPAARYLGVTHSAVSRALKELSLWLDVPVVKPRVRGAPMELTAHGKMLAEVALTSLNALHAATTEVREASGARCVTIATQPSVASRWLMPRLDALRTTFPRIEFSVVVDEGRMAPLDPGVDLTIRMGAKVKTGLHVCDLADDIAFPVISPTLWNDLGRPNDPAILRMLPLLHDRDTQITWARWRAEVGPEDMDIRRGPRFTTTDLVLTAAEAGQGVALVRGVLAAASISEGKLVRLFASHAIQLPGEWWIAEGRDLSARQQSSRVRDWLLAEYASTSIRN